MVWLIVQAFSSDKRGFMDLAEISSGTQRQIMLALRLALSQELINWAVKSRQFLFLDEPFEGICREVCELGIADSLQLKPPDRKLTALDEMDQILVGIKNCPGSSPQS